MAKKSVLISKKVLGMMVLIALIIDHILPSIGIRLGSLSTILYLIVGIYLLFLA